MVEKGASIDTLVSECMHALACQYFRDVDAAIQQAAWSARRVAKHTLGILSYPFVGVRITLGSVLPLTRVFLITTNKIQ
jgi:hypothetical protein